MSKRDMRAELAPGDRLTVEVSGVAHGGLFVARTPHGVVFVPDSLPGETVEVEIARVAKSFAHAETLRVLEAAPERVDHVWPEAAIDRAPERRAGGAEFGHIALPRQRELKAEVLGDAMARFGGLGTDAVVEAAPGDDARGGLGWRTRVRLQVDDRGRQGPFAARSHIVVPVTSIPLASEAIQRDAMLDQRIPGATVVDYVERSDGSVDIIASEGEPPAGPTETITQLVGDREFGVDRGGFWQVHREAAGVLTAAVQRAIDSALADPKAANLDLYGGVGLFAAALGDALGPATRVTSVEASEVATDHAAENLAEWIGAQALTADVERFVSDAAASASESERERYRAATIVLDPPRAGAGARVIEPLASLAPAQIVYVACDPVALARDTGLLRERGYELASLEAFDLFPHTHHLEGVAAFRRS